MKKISEKMVSEIFKRAIEEYGNHFKKIVFAIKQPVDAQSKNNFQTFQEILKK